MTDTPLFMVSQRFDHRQHFVIGDEPATMTELVLINRVGKFLGLGSKFAVIVGKLPSLDARCSARRIHATVRKCFFRRQRHSGGKCRGLGKIFVTHNFVLQINLLINAIQHVRFINCFQSFFDKSFNFFVITTAMLSERDVTSM